MNTIHLGYELTTGKPVGIDRSHVIVTGLTQKSGKTTTLEALITRSELRAIVFRTKPGERGFSQGNLIAPYFKEKSDWQYVASLLEATMKEKLKFERSWIMTACKGTSSLLEVQRNIQDQLANPKLRDLHRSVYTTLDEYLKLILPRLSVISFSRTLDVGSGINIMNLERMADEIQSLVIRSVLETVLHEMKDTIVVIPEAWKFLPQERGNPCKQAAEEFIRQGATNHNYLWIDSQDIAGVDKTPLKSVYTWILGLQLERNEVKHTLDQMPVPKRMRPKEEDVMTLQKGHFYVCTPHFSSQVYVQPAWLDAAEAEKVAKGLLSVDSIHPPLSSALAPLPKLQSTPEKDERLILLETLAKKLDDTRREFFTMVSDLRSYVGDVASLINNRPPEIAPAEEETVIRKVLERMPKAGPAANVATIVDEVLKRIPAQYSTSSVYEVAPVVALQKKFLEETKERMLTKITALDNDQKKLLKFIEAAGRGVEHGQLCERCFGLQAVGGNSAKVKQLRLSLRDQGLLRVDDKARSFPCLQDKLRDELQFHGATDEEVKQVYDHIIHSLLQETR